MYWQGLGLLIFDIAAACGAAEARRRRIHCDQESQESALSIRSGCAPGDPSFASAPEKIAGSRPLLHVRDEFDDGGIGLHMLDQVDLGLAG
jgi:hypothetical protein